MALDFPASPTTGDRVTLNSVIYEYDGAKWVTIRSLFDRGQFVAGTAVEPGFSVSTDTNTGLYAPGADQLAFTTGGVERVEFGTSEVVFNDGGIDYDFRIEGDADVNLVFADASTDRIGIGTSAPSVKIDIEASEPYVTLKNTTEEDTDGGREVRIDFEGEQSGGEASTLARIEVSHDGTADDEKGKVVISTNDGADAATPTTAVTIDSEQKVTIAGDLETNTINTLVYPDAGPLSNRNLIINGAMTVAQRSTSESGVTTDAYRSCDRYRVSIDSLGTWTISQSSNAPAGFTKSLRIECTTADASPAANDYIAILYHVEAQDVSWINYGTADAKPLMLSFYVRSNKTGSGSFAIRQRDNSNKLFSKVYAFDGTQDTWKKIEIPIPADTAGLINTDTGPGLTLEWWLNSGSTFTGGGATTGWEVFDDTKRNPTNAGIGDAVSDYFEITGVQLEVGSKSTPFEHRSYSDELQRCQRYYYRINANNGAMFGPGIQYITTAAIIVIDFPVNMRSNISAVEQSGTAGHYGIIYGTGTATCNAVPSFGGDPNNQNITVNFHISSGAAGAVGDGVIGRSRDNAAFLGFSAEL
jgi:hypothetical protein